MGIKVAKFGGSSVADIIQYGKVRAIALEDPDRRYIVVSAPGKRYDQDTKMTDLLYLCQAHLENNLPYDQLFQVVCDRFSAIAFELGISINLQDVYAKIKKEFSEGAGADYIASRGEYLSAMLMAEYLGYDFIDAADIIRFDGRGRLISDETNRLIAEALEKHERAVIPGFYGQTPDGRIKTFSRGGSDVTGALVAKAAKADVYENWTDVSGFLVANPKIVDDPLPIGFISYQELRELSYMGASVLHEDAVFPVREAGIPINIRNTNDPSHPGTIISENVPGEAQRTVTGVAGSKDFKVIAMHKHMINEDHGFVRKLFNILDSYDVPLEHLPTGIDTVSVVLNGKSVGDKLQDILEEFRKKLEPDSLEVLEDIALIATVGHGMSSKPGVAATLFGALADKNINIRMIDQGSSEINIIVGVNNRDFEEAVRAIYNAFI